MTVFEYVFSLYSLLFGQQASEHRAAGHHARQGYSRTAARVPPYCKATNAAIPPWRRRFDGIKGRDCIGPAPS